MTKEKQIDEMATKILIEVNRAGNEISFKNLATSLYNAGYRKQSEGEWVSNCQTDEYICNLCGAIAPVDCLKEDFYESKFCPECGAKMKGDSDAR